MKKVQRLFHEVILRVDLTFSTDKKLKTEFTNFSQDVSAKLLGSKLFNSIAISDNLDKPAGLPKVSVRYYPVSEEAWESYKSDYLPQIKKDFMETFPGRVLNTIEEFDGTETVFYKNLESVTV